MDSVAPAGAQRGVQANSSFFQRHPNVKTALKVAAVVLVVFAALVLVATVPHVIAGTVLAAALLKVSSATIFIAKVSSTVYLSGAAIALLIAKIKNRHSGQVFNELTNEYSPKGANESWMILQ